MDFSLILLIGLVVTGVVSLIYRLAFERSGSAVTASSAGSSSSIEDSKSLPTIVEYARALFPVILIVFVLRSFIVEPFRIPSGSMLPTLRIGDLILVNKFSYGLRLPVVHQKLIPTGEPERGDVMVFRYPRDPKLNFIKRVVGLPGDTLKYEGKMLTVNGNPVERIEAGVYQYDQKNLQGRAASQFLESLDSATYNVLIDDKVGGRDMEVTVPDGHYFVMGDNRDHSNDSRYWRFVPEQNVVGKAFFIWFNISGEWNRIGSTIQ
ncbi:MAG: signal peptidase I [Pseudomonadota bacterium]